MILHTTKADGYSKCLQLYSMLKHRHISEHTSPTRTLLAIDWITRFLPPVMDVLLITPTAVECITS